MINLFRNGKLDRVKNIPTSSDFETSIALSKAYMSASLKTKFLKTIEMNWL
jgi:hypothetical protein